MAWTKLNHDCRTPGQDELDRIGAKRGSVWSCECGKLWTLTSLGNPPIRPAEWKPASRTDITEGG